MAILSLLGTSCGSNKSLSYPDAPKDESVVDEYFGISVADPYRPLEDDTCEATLEWVKALLAYRKNPVSMP